MSQAVSIMSLALTRRAWYVRAMGWGGGMSLPAGRGAWRPRGN